MKDVALGSVGMVVGLATVGFGGARGKVNAGASGLRSMAVNAKLQPDG